MGSASLRKWYLVVGGSYSWMEGDWFVRGKLQIWNLELSFTCALVSLKESEELELETEFSAGD